MMGADGGGEVSTLRSSQREYLISLTSDHEARQKVGGQDCGSSATSQHTLYQFRQQQSLPTSTGGALRCFVELTMQTVEHR